MAEKTNKTVSHVKHVPKDAQVIMSIIKDMGITDYEPKVINQLLEFTYRYITCILDDSKVYANHAKKKFIDIEDVRLASKMQLERAFTNPPPRDVLLDVARAKNNIPLPFVKPNNGLRLPPDRYCLNSTNYRLKSEDKNETKRQMNKSINSTFIGGGAGRGNKLDARGPGVVKRSGTLSTVAKTQTITMPKPVLKFSTGGTGGASAGINKPKTPILTTQAQTPVQTPVQSAVKMEIDESAKRKREDDDYDIP